MKEKIILGIDPGSRVTGFGIIKKTLKGISVIDFGCIRPPQKLDISKRYLIIYDSVENLIIKHQPTSLAIETQFVYKNAQSALKLGMAKGVVMVVAAKHNIPLFEYAPKKAKLAVVGTGNASKHQVQKMMQMLLNLSKPPTPEDAADALALAICHAHQNPLEGRLNV
jgi:crossover junction endodeoxyribonuclease RuvC